MRNGKSLSFGAKRSLYENLYLDCDYRKTEIDVDFKSQREYQLYVLKSFFESKTNEDMFKMISYLKHDVEELTKWVKFEKMSAAGLSEMAGCSIQEFESLIESYNELIDFIESQILLA